jgi:hypothetical protein
MNLIDEPQRQFLDQSLISRLHRVAGALSDSVLMFSGGRDSTIAALRMVQAGTMPILTTVSSSHLIGIERVRKRVKEMEQFLATRVPWLVVRQPTELRTDTSFYEQTCLPCHHAYVVVGAAVAAKAGCKNLAFGYASYQNSWPEQTPYAIERLAAVLNRHAIQLLLPAYDLASREQAIMELSARTLSSEALEQKCIQQVNNVKLDQARLTQQVDLWESAIHASMASLSTINVEVMDVASNGGG